MTYAFNTIKSIILEKKFEIYFGRILCKLEIKYVMEKKNIDISYILAISVGKIGNNANPIKKNYFIFIFMRKYILDISYNIKRDFSGIPRIRYDRIISSHLFLKLRVSWKDLTMSICARASLHFT